MRTYSVLQLKLDQAHLLANTNPARQKAPFRDTKVVAMAKHW